MASFTNSSFNFCNWGEPERAPHKREVRAACLSVFLSVRTFMTRKYTRIVVIYGIPLVVDSSVYGAFGELLCMPTFNKHVATNNKNKQVLILRKQVYRSLIKIISLALLLLLKHSAPVSMMWNL